jgi:hypothetical protein
MRRIRLFPQNEMGAQKMRGMSGSVNWKKKLAVVQAATEGNRGGGERGSNELTELCGPERAVNDSKVAIAETETGAGRTKIAGATAGWSGLWQQDMLHCANSAISCPQFIVCPGPAGVCVW